jgi:hypothetical protein
VVAPLAERGDLGRAQAILRFARRSQRRATGPASGLVNVAHQLGASLGLSILVTVFAAAGGTLTDPTRLAHGAALNRVGARPGRRQGAPDELVFETATGSPLDSRNAATRVLKPASRCAGVPFVHWHTLRHTAVTSWAARAGTRWLSRSVPDTTPFSPLWTCTRLPRSRLPHPELVDQDAPLGVLLEVPDVAPDEGDVVLVVRWDERCLVENHPLGALP